MYAILDPSAPIPSAAFLLEELDLTSCDLVTLSAALRSALPAQLSLDLQCHEDASHIGMPDLVGLMRGAIFVSSMEPRYPETVPPSALQKIGAFKSYIGGCITVLGFESWCQVVLIPFAESKARYFTTVEITQQPKPWAEATFCSLWTQCAGFIGTVLCTVRESVRSGNTNVSFAFAAVQSRTTF